MFKITKGLNLPISGKPSQNIKTSKTTKKVALLGNDYVGLKPTMFVKIGDKVKLGQPLFEDKKNPKIPFTAPASGTVIEINRGDKRAFKSLVIETSNENHEVLFPQLSDNELKNETKENISNTLIESGLWNSFRTRPFGKVPAINSEPADIFISTIDTNPLAAEPMVAINKNKKAFIDGIIAISKLTKGNTFLCTKPNDGFYSIDECEIKHFEGVHPAGNVGTHMHFLSPVHREKTSWYIGYQDVMAIGKLFTEGKICIERIISIAGPQVKEPALIKTHLGADINELVQDELLDGNNRIINGSVWNGTTIDKDTAYLGKYTNQVSVLKEGDTREFMGWIAPGKNKFSIMNMFTSMFSRNKEFDFTTTTNGSERAMVPTGQFERLMPMDILPTQLLRAIVVGDMEAAIDLGVLELEEEDLALCTFACVGKYEYGPILRDQLNRIEKEA